MKKLFILASLLFSMTPHADTPWPEEHPDNAYSAAISEQDGDFSWRIDLFLWYQWEQWWLKIQPTDTFKGAICLPSVTAVQNKKEYGIGLTGQGGSFFITPCRNRVTEVYILDFKVDRKAPFDFYYYDAIPDKEVHFKADASDFAGFIPPEPESTTRLSNISTRGKVGAAPDLLYGGFIVTGEGTATIYIKGGAVDDGLDTTLRIVDSEGSTIAENDDWQNDVRLDEVPDHLKPKKLTDSGLLLDLKAGTYNALVSAKDKPGHAIVSVWEIR